MGLEPGDEIGLFDNNGLLSSDCTNEIGEILVGAGVYTGVQLEIVAIGSLDFCDAGGEQHPGFIENNPVVFKIWKHETNHEFSPNDVEFSFGENS
jgi:hypothetical protein